MSASICRQKEAHNAELTSLVDIPVFIRRIKWALSLEWSPSEVFEVCLKSHTIVISKHILSEIERVLIKKIHLPRNITASIIDYLRDVAELFEPQVIEDSACRDIEDRKIIGTAVSGNAQLIITGDDDLLTLKKFMKIDIVTPREFWNRLRK